MTRYKCQFLLYNKVYKFCYVGAIFCTVLWQGTKSVMVHYTVVSRNRI